MIHHHELSDAEVRRAIRSGAIRWAGNRSLRIYGRLDCWSGRKLARENRVFFSTELDAVVAGFRPCGHCMRERYRRWRATAGGRRR